MYCKLKVAVLKTRRKKKKKKRIKNGRNKYLTVRQKIHRKYQYFSQLMFIERTEMHINI